MTTYLLTASRNYLASYAGLSKSCWQGIALSFVETTLIGVYYFLPFYFIHDLHFTLTTAGLMISFYGMGTILGGFLGGKLSDAFSPGIISIASLFLQAIVFIALMKLTSFHYLIMALFVMGVASYGFITSNHLWVLGQCEGCETKRLKAINILSAASNLGLGLSSALVSMFAIYGFDNIFSLSCVLLVLSGIYFWFLEKSQADDAKADSITKVASKQSVAQEQENKKIVYLVLTCVFLVGLIIFQSTTTYSTYVQQAFPELGIKSISILFTLNSLLVVFFQAPIVNVVHHWNKMLIIGVGAFLLGFGMFMLTFSYIFALAMLATVVYTTGEILFFSVAQFMCYQQGGAKKQGQSLGIFRTIYASSRVAAPAAGTFIFQNLGGNVLWYLCGGIGVMCLVACSYYRRYG